MSALPKSPYKGLAAFADSALDAQLFFGREREVETVVANVLASRLTVLYGPSGVGKSSLLRAGVAQRLRELEGAAVVVHDAWAEEPALALATAVRDACEALGPTAGLVDTVAAAAQERGEVYLLLDQFEEYFLYHGADGELAEALPELLRRPGLRVNVLLALRDDALATLDAFSGRLPGLFGNMLRLERLGEGAARAAVVRPLERFGELAGRSYDAEPELVEAVLAGVTAEPGEVEAPFLQLVLERLWEEEQAQGSARLRLETFERLGGARPIVQAHVRGALERLDPVQQDEAARVVRQLVTPSGSKVSHTAADLAEYAQVDGEELRALLATLARERLLRVVEGAAGGPERYEIFHDVLAEPLLAWRASYELERERRRAHSQHRRLWALVTAALVALAIVSAIAIFALTQRASARTQARRAHARALAAQALADLPTDPPRSVALALRAVDLAPTTQAEDVLRQSVLALRERRVIRVGGDSALAAFAPHGDRLVAAGSSGHLELLRGDGSLLRELPRRAGVTRLVWSDDGSLFAVGSVDGRAEVRRAGDGSLLRSVELTAPVTGLSFAGDRLLVAGGRRIVVVDPATGVRQTAHVDDPILVAALSARPGTYAFATKHGPTIETRLVAGGTARLLPERGIRSLGFSPDGSLLATGSADDTARIWDARSGRRLHVLGHSGHVLAERFSPDGRTLATASADGTAGIWDVRSGVRLLLLVGSTGAAEDVAFDPDGLSVVVADADRFARIYSRGDGRLLATLAGHRDAVTGVGYDERGNTIVSAGADGSVRLWDASAGDELTAVDRRDGPVRALFEGSEIVTVAGREARLLDASGRVDARLVEPAPLVDAVARPGQLALLDARGNVHVRGANAHGLAGARVAAIAFTPDRLAYGTRTGRVGLLGDRLSDAIRIGEPVVSISAAGGRIAVRTASGEIRVYTLSGRLLARLHEPAQSVRISPDGSVLVTTQGRDAGLWDAATGKPLHVLAGHRSTILDAEFSPDGHQVVTASADHDSRIWDVRSGRLLHVLRGHFFAVRTAQFSPDGRWIVTSSQFTAGLWDARTGRLVLYLRGHTRPLTGASFSPDGTLILTASEDGTARTVTCDVCRDLAGLERVARERLAQIR